jgi:two-component system, LytTR family, sensor kinase
MKLPSVRAIARAYLISLLVWCGIALLMGVQASPFNPQNPREWLVNLLVEVAPRAFAMTFWTPPIFYLVRRLLNSSINRFAYVFLWSVGAFPFVLLHTTILWLLIPPTDVALQSFGPRSLHSLVEMLRTSFADIFFIYVALLAAAHAYEYLRRVRTQERESYEYQHALAASELQVLKMQLHPHFLFNTLHGIATLVESDPKTATAMILKLSNLLRTSLDRTSSDLVQLQDELSFVGDYLDLEKMRFGSRLRTEWQIAPETRRMLVPQMVLQPLVENAIRHGLSSSREAGWIEIAAGEGNGKLTIRLRNSVGGKTSNGAGVGLRNAQARLKYLYSGDATLCFAIDDDHTATVNLVLPALNSQPRGAPEHPARSLLEKGDSLCAFSSSTTNP